MEENMYKFSIIVPVYNVEQYLERCVEMLAGQHDSCEVLLVDDGSRDSSGQMCDSFASEYEYVKAFHKPNGGLSSARNYGIDRAKGEYILFVDSDDYVETSMCRVLEDYISKAPDAEVIAYDGIEEGPQGNCGIRRGWVKQAESKDGHDFLLESYKQRTLHVEAWLYAFKREYLEKNHLRFKEGVLAEDVEFTPRAVIPARQVLSIPEAFYHYIIRGDSLTAQTGREKNIRDFFQILKEQCELAEQQDEELCKWMKNSVLDRYLDRIYGLRMYRKEYRHLVDKKFLLGKAATSWNRFRVALCLINLRLYCMVNDGYKALRG